MFTYLLAFIIFISAFIYLFLRGGAKCQRLGVYGRMQAAQLPYSRQPPSRLCYTLRLSVCLSVRPSAVCLSVCLSAV